VVWFGERIKETFLLNEFLTLGNLAGLVRERLSWMKEGFEGRIDLGSSNGPRVKTMSLMCNEKEWAEYVRVMIEGAEKATRGGEWESIKILRKNLSYIAESTRCSYLLTRLRPSSYSQAIDPRNQARNRSENTKWC
jgi:hypothetical protein